MQLFRFWRSPLAALIQLIRRHPNIMAMIGFIAGTLSFILVKRQEETSRIIALLMLMSWLWLVLEHPIRDALRRYFGFKLAPVALKFATQLVHQESLFFALPFFVITTNWLTPQSLFTLLLIGAAAVSVVDPLYYKRIVANRWLYPLYHGFTLFALLLTTLPIVVKMTTNESYVVSLVIAGVVSVPMVTRVLTGTQWWIKPAQLAVLLVMGFSGWLAQPWVPPATLWVKESAVTHTIDIDARSPKGQHYTLAEQDIYQQGVYVYTAIRAPLGLHELIYHEWHHNGVLLDRIPLEITGGREDGYRSWSRKNNFPANTSGRWDINILTEGNQLIGQHTFVVIP